MLIKLAALIALAIYFFYVGEPLFAIMAVGASVPFAGLVVAAILAVMLILKTWYLQSAIVVVLIAFSVARNAFLKKTRMRPPESPVD